MEDSNKSSSIGELLRMVYGATGLEFALRRTPGDDRALFDARIPPPEGAGGRAGGTRGAFAGI